MRTAEIIDNMRKVFKQIGKYYFIIMIFWLLIALSEQNYGSFTNGQAYRLEVQGLRQFTNFFLVLLIIIEIIKKLCSNCYEIRNMKITILSDILPYILWSISFTIFFNAVFGGLFYWYAYHQSNTINLLIFLAAAAYIVIIINFVLSQITKILVRNWQTQKCSKSDY